MDTQAQIVGKRIQNLRKKKGITQEELGYALELTQNSISKIETGATALTLSNLIKIANYFKVSTDYICTGQKGENYLSLLEKYSNLEYVSGSCGEMHYDYPILKINKSYFEYLIHIARAKSDKLIPDDIKELWINKEIQAFSNSRDFDTFTEYITVVPVPNDFIYPDDQKSDWKQSDLLKNVDSFFTSNSYFKN